MDLSKIDPTQLTPGQKLQYIATPALWGQIISQGAWKLTRHLDYIDKAIRDALTGRAPNVLIMELPVRHGKSTSLMNLISWYLCRYPNKHAIFSTATDGLAQRCSRKIRKAVQEHGPQWWGVDVMKGSTSLKQWETTAGGSLRAAGVGGDIVGLNGDLLVLDDYLRNSTDAQSDTIRDKQWDWLESTFLSRQQPNSCVILSGTRWHLDDVLGRFTGESDEFAERRQVPFRRITLPAIAEDEDELGREPGEALWPEYWPIGSSTEQVLNAYGERVNGLALTEATKGPYWWNALYQQHPTKHESTYWPTEYFEDILTDYWPDKFEIGTMGIDPSRGKTKRSDFSALVFTGFTSNTLWVDAVIERLPTEHLIDQAIQRSVELKPVGVAYETNNNQDLIFTEMDRRCRELGILPLVIYPRNHSMRKEIRIQSLGQYFQRHAIKIRNTPGGRLLVKQLSEFPVSGHDDGPDGLEMSIELLNRIAHQRFLQKQHSSDVEMASFS